MADETPVDYDAGWIRKELRGVELCILGHKEKLSLDIVNLRYDIVLGMAWLVTHNLKIDWKAQVLEFPLCSYGTETGDRLSLRVPFAKAIWVRP